MPTRFNESIKKDANGNTKKTSKIEGIINNIEPNLYNEIKESYFGGHTDMFIPAGPVADVNGFAKPEEGKLVPHNNKHLYEYDVNSLYPSVMANNVYPTKLFGEFIVFLLNFICL